MGRPNVARREGPVRPVTRVPTSPSPQGTLAPPGQPVGRTDRGKRNVVAVLLIVLLVIVAALLLPYLWPHGPPGGSNAFTLATSLAIQPSGGGRVGPDLLGVNVRPDASFGTYEEGLLNYSAASLIRWPGGGIADRYNGTALGGQGIIYNDDGSNQTASASLATFARWCVETHCAVVYTLPAEVASPSTAAFTVSWIEGTLGLHPLYWEVGNEPALWTHYGIPWSQWTTTQAIAPSASQYAILATSIALAVHRVDPTARVLALGGLGKGGGGEAAWINATMQDGLQGGIQQFAGAAVHVYPAGGGWPGESDEQVYASLSGGLSVASRAAADWAAVRSYCPSCVLLDDEEGAGSGNALSSFMSGFPMVSFAAAQVVQGYEANVTSLDYFVLEGGYPGAWAAATGGPTHPVYTLYTNILPRLGPTWLPVRSSVAAPNLYAIATESATQSVLLVANCDQNRTLQIALGGSGFPFAPAGSAWAWNSTDANPVGKNWPQHGPENWTLGPEGVLLLTTTSGLSPSAHPGPRPALQAVPSPHLGSGAPFGPSAGMLASGPQSAGSPGNLARLRGAGLTARG